MKKILLQIICLILLTSIGFSIPKGTIFVSDYNTYGNFRNVTNIDKKCQIEAEEMSWTGSWTAMLCNISFINENDLNTTLAIHNIEKTFNTRGEILAESLSELLDGTDTTGGIDNFILTRGGNNVSKRVWTGCTPNATIAEACKNRETWSPRTGTIGKTGVTDGKFKSWLSDQTRDCYSESLSFYCIKISGDCSNGDSSICVDNVISSCIYEEWKNEICQYGCNSTDSVARCNECSSSMKECLDNNTLKYCDNGLNSTMTCPNGCNAIINACKTNVSINVSVCKEGDFRCSGNGLQICNNSIWVLNQSCPKGCNSTLNECNTLSSVVENETLCVEGEKECEDDKIKECANNTWTIVENCSGTCVNNKCIDSFKDLNDRLNILIARIHLRNPSNIAELNSKILEIQTAIEQDDKTKAESLIIEVEDILKESSFPWIFVSAGIVFIIILVAGIMFIIPKVNKPSAAEKNLLKSRLLYFL